MRADRLVAILLLLQRRGHVTAAEVAAELEVSERTARRDLDALGAAGLPVYAQRGRNGGWRLAGGGRTDLSGLNAAEVRALFMVAGPARTTPEVRSAVRKLVRAIPEPFRPAAEAMASSVVIDPAGWGSTSAAAAVPPQLDAVQDALVAGVQVRIAYTDRRRASTERLAHPLGLAAKGTLWYLLAGTEHGTRLFRVDRITRVEPTGAPVVKPTGFDLAATWREVAADVDELRAPLAVQALADPSSLGLMRRVLGTRLRVGPPQGHRVEVELRGHTVGSIAAEIAGMVAFLEVLGPVEVRQELASIGSRLADRYV